MNKIKQAPKKGTGENMPQVKVSKVVNLARIDSELSFEEIVEEIKSDAYKDTTLLIRKLLKEGNTAEADKVKMTLPGFACSGIFSRKRTTANLQAYSQCVVLDFDDLPVNKMKQLVKLASQCKYTLISFISISGCGIKILVRVNTSTEHHKEAYQQVMEYYEKLLGVKADKATKDIARLCFFAHDKNVFYNETAEVFTINLSASNTKVEDSKELKKMESLFVEAVKYTDNIRTLVPGQRNDYIYLLVCNCKRLGLTAEETFKNIQSQLDHGLPESEVKNCIDSAYSNNVIEFGVWSSKHKQENKNADFSLSDLEHCFRNVLSEFFNPLNKI